MPTPLVIRDEAAADRAAIFDVERRAFGRDDEAVLVDRLRDDGDVLASFVALRDDVMVGHVLFGPLPVTTAAGVVQAASLAPVAVAPEHQGQGVGSALIRHGLTRCQAIPGVVALIVLGDPAYYARFGFSAKAAEPLRCPFSGNPAFMAMALGDAPVPAGEVRYPAAFGLEA